MFDKHVHVLGPRSIDVHHTVTEHRAPTDESVRLLKEMEAAAREKVVQSIRLESNDFNAVVQEQYDPLNDQRHYRVIFSANGKRVEVMHTMKSDAKPQEIADELLDVVGRKVAAEALAPAFKEVARRLRFTPKA